MWRLGRPLVFGALAAALGGAAFFSCTANDTTDPAGGGCTDTAAAELRASEWVSFHTEVPIAAEQIHPLLAGLLGKEAQAGKFVTNREITPGVFASGSAESATPEQARLTLAFDDEDGKRRTLAVAPTSFAIGGVFITAVDAAVDKMISDTTSEPGSGEAFLIEYRVFSAQGGKLSWGVRGNGGVFSLVVDVTSPQTSLEKGKVGTAVRDFEPHDTVAGTVWFHLSKDDFDFFTEHAYGAGATSKQNFKDFKLVPHEWLRLTVEPDLGEQLVNVGFEVVGVDGSRTPVAKAPASILAGGTFRALVDRNLVTMRAQEQAAPGSSTPWQVPFYYDDPDGGGVVQVIAQGAAGQFSIAYAVESPRHELTDVPFVPHEPVEIVPPDPEETASCEELDDPDIKPAPKGTLDITFVASKTIKESPDKVVPLVGPISCAVYHKAEVEITGPIEGAVELQSFTIEAADLESAKPPTAVTAELFSGEYQILCYQDLDANGDASPGDPVTIPIGGYTVHCNKNPVTVEFAILYPK